MPSLAGKSKPKARDGRQSPSRNTTPSSIASLPFTVAVLSTAYLDIPVSSLVIPPNITYDDILERHGGGGGIPDPKNLELMANDLNTLSLSAETRGQACDGAMRELAKRRKERIEADRVRELASREAEEKENLKRAAEEEDDAGGKKAGRLKKRKDRINAKEERPLAHGAHGVARQDGGDLLVKGAFSSLQVRLSLIRITFPNKSSQTIILTFHLHPFRSFFLPLTNCPFDIILTKICFAYTWILLAEDIGIQRKGVYIALYNQAR